MASLILGAVGASIGYQFGFASLGWSIGSTIGRYFEPGQTITQEGPRVQGLRLQDSAYGIMIPIVSGNARLAGNLIWSGPLIETRTVKKESSGGKGGGGAKTKTITYTYSISLAVSICEGPVLGVGRIWANGIVIYDGRSAGASAIVGGAATVGSVAVYTGTETQLPDPTMEAYQGAGNVPAYRGQCYVVLSGLQLEKFGNAIPNLTFEVIENGSYSDARIVGEGVAYDSTLSYQYSPDGYTYAYKFESVSLGGYYQLQLKEYLVTLGGVLTATGNRWVENYASGTLEGPSGVYDRARLMLTIMKTSKADTEAVYWTHNGSLIQTEMLPLLNTAYAFPYGTAVGSRYSGDIWVPFVPIGETLPVCGRTTVGFIATSKSTNAAFEYITPNTAKMPDCQGDDGYWYHYTGSVVYKMDAYLNIVATISGSFHPAAADTFKLFAVEGGNFYFRSISYPNLYRAPVSGTTAYYSTSGSHEYGYFLAYLGNGLVLCVTDTMPYKYRFVSLLPYMVVGTMTLQSLVEEMCARSALEPSEYDASLLTTLIDGYVLGEFGDLRSALEPLQKAFQFDAVESNGQIKFVPRGTGSVVTIHSDDTLVEVQNG